MIALDCSGQSPIVWKTSLFAHVVNGNTLWNDLADKCYAVDDCRVSILKAFHGCPQSIGSYLQRAENSWAGGYLAELVTEHILVPQELEETASFYPHRVEIETVAHCNARCVYCPQSIFAKPKKFMSDRVFERVMSALSGYQVSWISFSHYGEPLLDPGFKNKVERLTNNHLKLLLFTNGTLLTADLVSFLAKHAPRGILFNFPSLEPDEWCAWMNLSEDAFYRTRHNIETAIQTLSGSPIQLGVIVNVRSNDQLYRMDRIRDHFSAFGKVELIRSDTNSRAGAISNSYVREVDFDQQYFAGCERVVGHLHVSSEGKCYLCCQDYHQRTVLGDLMKEDILEIMRGNVANQLRSEIYGVLPMRIGLMCRHCTRLRTSKFG